MAKTMVFANTAVPRERRIYLTEVSKVGAEMLSVGIDIGTTTTQVVFSKLSVEDTASPFAVPNVAITGKELVYKSGIHYTPFSSRTEIDGKAIKAIVEKEFKLAGYSPAEVRTGAVIITGESARKENARIVAESLSRVAGDFVVATAGPDLEAIIAGKGSGAELYSIEYNCTVANLDIGGGTTNIVLFDSGDVIAKGCLDIGGRLIRVSPDLQVEYLSEKAGPIASTLGIALSEGRKVSLEDLRKITTKMSDILFGALGFGTPEKLLKDLETGGSTPYQPVKPVHYVSFSGGVADCIYQNDSISLNCSIGLSDLFKYGDIGVLLGQAIRESALSSSVEIIRPGETIRATVIGAGAYTTSLSGSTITYSQDLFPLKNVPVLRLDKSEEVQCFLGEGKLLSSKINWFLQQSLGDCLALGFQGKKDPSFTEIKLLAKGIADAFRENLSSEIPIIVVLKNDMAKVLGQTLNRYLAGLAEKRGIICLDGIRVAQGDYLDMGKPVANGLVIPVVVKTLIFG